MFGKARASPRTSTCRASTARNGFKLSGVAADDDSGFSVASAGDVNGDGFADLIVGAPAAIRTAPTPARAMWCSARPRALPPNIDLSSLDGTNGFKLSGVAAERLAAASVASAGDVNGDGFADLIVGASLTPTRTAPIAGASYVVFGRAPDTAVNRTGTACVADARRRRFRRHAVGARRRRHAVRPRGGHDRSTAVPRDPTGGLGRDRRATRHNDRR